MISQTLSSNLAAHFDECFLVLGQLIAEDAQHMMIIVSQLDILKCLQTFDLAAFGFKPLDGEKILHIVHQHFNHTQYPQLQTINAQRSTDLKSIKSQQYFHFLV